MTPYYNWPTTVLYGVCNVVLPFVDSIRFYSFYFSTRRDTCASLCNDAAALYKKEFIFLFFYIVDIFTIGALPWWNTWSACCVPGWLFWALLRNSLDNKFQFTDTKSFRLHSNSNIRDLCWISSEQWNSNRSSNPHCPIINCQFTPCSVQKKLWNFRAVEEFWKLWTYLMPFLIVTQCRWLC